MSVGRPSARDELPWLRSGPLLRVHRSASECLNGFLARHSYRRFELRGRAMTSRAGAHSELVRAFDFPGCYGANWDAFDECFDEFLEQHAGAPVAVVWHDLDVCARVAPATAAEVGRALLEERAVALDVFALGDSDDFDRP